MEIKIENLDQLMLDFNESFIDEREVKYSDFNQILELLKENVLNGWNESNISAAIMIPYKESVIGKFYLDGDCVFLLIKFERGEDSNDDVKYTYEYNGTIS